MENKIILGRILQRFIDRQVAQVGSYNAFGFVKIKNSSILVSREAGEDTPIPFSKLIIGIEAYKEHLELYDKGPTALRAFGITHVTSPVYSLLHLLEKDAYW